MSWATASTAGTPRNPTTTGPSFCGTPVRRASSAAASVARSYGVVSVTRGTLVVPGLLEPGRATRASTERGDVVDRSVRRLGRVREHAEVRRGGQTALVGVQDVGPHDHLATERRDAHPGLAVEPRVRRLPAVEPGLVLLADVLDSHQNLVE